MKTKYKLYFCPLCETIGVARKQTKKEREDHIKKIGDKSISKFEHSPLIEISACRCEETTDYVLGWPVNKKKAEEYIGIY